MADSKLAKAIASVMGEVHGVQKTGNNTQQHYTYASDADILVAVRASMVKHGLVMVPSSISSTVRDTTFGRNNTPASAVDATYTWTLLHNSGESVQVMSLGSGIDTGDKAAYKAATGALKYALRQVFLLPTGDDPEIAMSEDEKADAKRKASHHPSWERGGREKLFAQLAEGGVTLTYDELCAELEKIRPGGDRPSQMDQNRRDLMAQFIIAQEAKRREAAGG